jgi:hypothetical protein
VALEYLQRWSMTFLPWLNRQILAGCARPEDLVDALNRAVLIDLPSPDALTPRQAKQAVVMLSFTGASVTRHYQERHRRYRHAPRRAFQRLAVGAEGVPFLSYFERLAERTGTGHPARDSYVSLVRWNVPTCRVHWHGEQLACLPGALDDGQVRTYTGDLGERLFFELTKKCETVERAVNDLLLPIVVGDLPVAAPGAIYRIRLATTMLTALRRLQLDFGRLPGGEGLAPEHFIDVFRQFAGHWRTGDIPPSGALDPEALKRDLLIGLDLPDLHGHLLRVFPALLDAERAELGTLMSRPPLPDQVLAGTGLTRELLAGLQPSALPSLIREHPEVAAVYLLCAANARASAAHLSLVEKYLFRPARQREAAGIPDSPVVSNWRGTTGMDEPLLARLVRLRQAHALAPLNAVPRAELLRLAGLDLPDVVTSDQVDSLVSLGGAGEDPGGSGDLVAPSGYRP